MINVSLTRVGLSDRSQAIPAGFSKGAGQTTRYNAKTIDPRACSGSIGRGVRIENADNRELN
jgi:hypothetical protein